MRAFVTLLVPVILAFPARAEDTKLAVKLGPDEAWQVGPYQGGKVDAVNIDGDGRPATAVGANGLVLTTKVALARDTNCSCVSASRCRRDRAAGSRLSPARKARRRARQSARPPAPSIRLPIRNP